MSDMAFTGKRRHMEGSVATYELAPSREAAPTDGPGVAGMTAPQLRESADWFIRLRWLVVYAFAGAGAATAAPPVRRLAGLEAPALWLLALALVLAGANAVFLIFQRRAASTGRGDFSARLWLQIVVDLLILTIVVHRVGSTSTAVAFTYVLHIVLACMFWPRVGSLAVTLLAAALYLGCVAAEQRGLLLPARPPHPQPMTIAVSIVMVWGVVWMLVSRLSSLVWARERELSRANEQLRAVDREINRKVLRTTHDLKAPFSAIQTNIQLLRMDHWEALPPEGRTRLDRIEASARTLSARIRDRLRLAELRAGPEADEPLVPVALQDVLRAVEQDLKEAAAQRRIRLEVEATDLWVLGRAEPLIMLFANLVSNAIAYSRPEGAVTVRAATVEGRVRVTVRDTGIGIVASDLPRIFDEYYRGEAAARVNASATGVGLTIVREVAASLRLPIRVTSAPGRGTLFAVDLQPASPATQTVSCQAGL